MLLHALYRLSFCTDYLLYYEVFLSALGNGKVSSCTAAEGSFTSLTGLLEVEPLHFTCVSTSDGTRIERDDASTFTGIYLLLLHSLCSNVQE